MKIEPIHEIPTEGLERIIGNAKQFIEWGIEPKHCHLYALVESIKQSLIHFLPNDEALINEIRNSDDATMIIDTFSSWPHPLKEGLIAIRKIFDVTNSEQEPNYSEIRWAINDFLETIEPYALKERLNAYHLTQSEKGRKPRHTKDLTPQERDKRNQEIKKHFQEVSAKSALTLNGFAHRYAKKYNLSPSGMKKIITS